MSTMEPRFFFLLILLLFIACGPESIVDKDENGVVLARYEVKDAIKHGQYIGYNPDGSVFEESTFVNGAQEGIRKIYHLNGAIQAKETYVKDVLDGKFEEYYPSGKLSFTGTYVNNNMEGVWQKFYESGQLEEEVTFVGSEENGPFKEYHPNGNIAAEGEYINGDNEHGLLLLYDEAGTLIKKMNCEYGVCRTIWTSDEDS